MDHHVLGALVVIVSTLALSACGGGGGGGETTSSSSAPRTRDYTLEVKSPLALHHAFATFTESGDRTTAVIDFRVDTSKTKSGALYPVAIVAGLCSKPGEVRREIGELPNGINTLTVDAPLDDIVADVDSSEASVVITQTRGGTVMWCGPS